MPRTCRWLCLWGLLLAVLCTACTTAPAPSATPTRVEKPEKQHYGGTLVCPLPEDATTLNPLTANSRELCALCALSFEGLLQMDAAGEPVACLAESWTTEDGQNWVFVMRSGAVWQHNGRALEGRDVTFTLDLLRQMGENTPYAYVFDCIESYSARGNQLTITGKTPFYGLLFALTFPVVPYDGGFGVEECPALPAGTGPYQVQRFTAGSVAELTANEHWWRQQPQIHSVRAVAMTDTQEALTSLVYSQVDVVMTDDVNVGQYSAVGASTNVEYTTRDFEYLLFNHRKADLQSPQLRQAIAYAMDKSAMVSYTYANHGIVVDTPVAPDSFLYSGRVLSLEQDIRHARTLLAQSGWQDTDDDGVWDLSPTYYDKKLELVLLVPQEESGTRRANAQLLQQQLQEAGILLTVNLQPWDTYVQMLQQGQFDLALCRTVLSPIPDLSVLLGSEGALNYGAYQNTEMEAVLSAVTHAPTRAALLGASEQLETLFLQEMPLVPLCFRTHTMMTAPELCGISNVRERAGYASISNWYFSD